MLETSKDFLNVVIALCVLFFTIFICWMIYYVAMIFKRIHEVMEKFTNTLDAVSQFFTKAKEKIDKTTSNLSLLIELGKKAFDFVKDRQEKKKAKKSKVAEEI